MKKEGRRDLMVRKRGTEREGLGQGETQNELVKRAREMRGKRRYVETSGETVER